MDYCMRAYGAEDSDHQIKIRQYLLIANLPNFPAIQYYSTYVMGKPL